MVYACKRFVTLSMNSCMAKKYQIVTSACNLRRVFHHMIIISNSADVYVTEYHVLARNNSDNFL